MLVASAMGRSGLSCGSLSEIKKPLSEWRVVLEGFGNQVKPSMSIEHSEWCAYWIRMSNEAYHPYTFGD